MLKTVKLTDNYVIMQNDFVVAKVTVDELEDFVARALVEMATQSVIEKLKDFIKILEEASRK